jgi:hypothetical protein
MSRLNVLFCLGINLAIEMTERPIISTFSTLRHRETRGPNN